MGQCHRPKGETEVEESVAVSGSAVVLRASVPQAVEWVERAAKATAAES